MLVILAVSYFAHIVIKFKLLFSEYKCLDHSGIYTRKNGGAHSKHTKHFSKFKRHKDTTRVIAYTKMFGFFYVLSSLWIIFLPGRSDPKNKKLKG